MRGNCRTWARSCSAERRGEWTSLRVKKPVVHSRRRRTVHGSPSLIGGIVEEEGGLSKADVGRERCTSKRVLLARQPQLLGLVARGFVRQSLTRSNNARLMLVLLSERSRRWFIVP